MHTLRNIPDRADRRQQSSALTAINRLVKEGLPGLVKGVEGTLTELQDKATKRERAIHAAQTASVADYMGQLAPVLRQICG